MYRKLGMNRRGLLVALLLTLVTTETFAQMAFISRRDIDLPEFNGPVAVATADLNNDGVPDLAIANAFPGTISILLGVGGGSFVPSGTYPVEFHPFSIVIRDFNNDGKLDMAVANYSLPLISILLGNGDGTFQSTSYFEVSAPPTTVTAGDFNNDGKLDLAVACLGPFDPEFPERSNDKISVLLGDGQGNFTTAPPCGRDITVGRAPEGVTVGDFNGDGNVDLAVANLFSHNVTVLLGDGTGCFRERVDYPAQLRPSTVVVGDFNNDGIDDLASLNELSGTVSTFAGNGNGTFRSAANSPSAPPLAIGLRFVAEYLDQDDKLDLAIAGANNEARVLLGDGAGGFTGLVRSFTTGADITAGIAVGDFNGDGVVDIVTANKGTVMPPPPPNRVGNVTLLTGDGLGNFGNFFKTDRGAAAVAMGDFYEDGLLDMAVANTDSNDVTLFAGDNKGGLFYMGAFTVGNRPVAIVAGDFNRDGKLDLAVANSGTSNNVTILFGDGLGNFPTRRDFNVGTAPNHLVVADFNGDNKPDLAVVNLGSNDVTVLLGDGAGGFPIRREVALSAGARPYFITTADFNNDGKLDLAVANSGTDNVTVLLGDGAGNFPTREVTALPAGSRPYSLAFGRINADAHLDLAVANNGTNNVTLLFGNGTGRFPTNRSIALPGGVGPSGIVAGDFNRDTKLDLAVAQAGSNNVSILQGDGTGNFTQPISPSPFVGLNPRAVALADVDADGKPDLIFVNSGSSTISILFNKSR